MTQKARYLLLSVLVLILDQWTKRWVELNLPLHRSKELIPGFLDLTHVQNSGVAFGLFAAQGRGTIVAALTAVGLLALAIVGVYFARTPLEERWTLTGLGLILGGAVGNLVDRVTSGVVTDFIDAYVGKYHWHTFNIADSAITVGIGLMAIDIFRRRESSESVDDAATESSTAG